MAIDDDHPGQEYDPDAAAPRAELARLLRSWRKRLDPSEIPGLHVGHMRQKKKVSQEDLARLIGVSSVWYGNLERGELLHYSDDFLDRASIALRLSDAERMTLYLYSVGREPAPCRPGSGFVVTEGMRKMVDEQSWPTYVSDESWDVVCYNTHVRKWFPWIERESNVMRWVFTYPEARVQLYDWGTDWAPLMLAQMRVAHARDPDNARLTELIE